MYKNKLNLRNNIIGINVKRLRYSHEPYLSQNDVAVKLQTVGYNIEKNAISQLENGSRFGIDFEIIALANVFEVPLEELFSVKKALEFVEKNPEMFKSNKKALFSSENLPPYIAAEFNKSN
ncbi:MAG: helix-turn-helix transcriptional regulator [Treponema sp.]|nr:helix-turn-helix transcriptional regulator [Treponema sp.]MDY5124588.1 helix-turn-helix transcriptional regulator [Treponema sp.]